MNTNIDKSVAINDCSVVRGLDICEPRNEHLINPSQQELGELLEELLIRFDSDPKYYQKEDFRVLIEALRKVICAATGETTLVINSSQYKLEPAIKSGDNGVRLVRRDLDGNESPAGEAFFKDTKIKRLEFDQGILTIFTTDDFAHQVEIPLPEVQNIPNYTLDVTSDENNTHVTLLKDEVNVGEFYIPEYHLKEQPFSVDADGNYTADLDKSVGIKNGIVLKRGDTVVDAIAWPLDVDAESLEDGSTLKRLTITKDKYSKSFYIGNSGSDQDYTIEQKKDTRQYYLSLGGIRKGAFITIPEQKEAPTYDLSEESLNDGFKINLQSNKSSTVDSVTVPKANSNNLGLAKVCGETDKSYIKSASGEYYGVEITKDGRLVVRIPQEEKPKTYTLTVEVVGEDYESKYKGAVLYGEPYTTGISKNEITIDSSFIQNLNIDPHFNFKKWGYGGSTYDSFTISNINSDITVYAIVTPEEYQVTFSGINTELSFSGEDFIITDLALGSTYQYLEEVKCYFRPRSGYGISSFVDNQDSVNENNYTMVDSSTYLYTFKIEEDHTIVVESDQNSVTLTIKCYIDNKEDSNNDVSATYNGRMVQGGIGSITWDDHAGGLKLRFDSVQINDGPRSTDKSVLDSVELLGDTTVNIYFETIKYALTIYQQYGSDQVSISVPDIPYGVPIDLTSYKISRRDGWVFENYGSQTGLIRDGASVTIYDKNPTIYLIFNKKLIKITFYLIKDAEESNKGIPADAIKVVDSDYPDLKWDINNDLNKQYFSLPYGGTYTITLNQWGEYHPVAITTLEPEEALLYCPSDWQRQEFIDEIFYRTGYTINNLRQDTSITCIFSQYSPKITYNISIEELPNVSVEFSDESYSENVYCESEYNMNSGIVNLQNLFNNKDFPQTDIIYQKINLIEGTQKNYRIGGETFKLTDLSTWEPMDDWDYIDSDKAEVTNNGWEQCSDIKVLLPEYTYFANGEQISNSEQYQLTEDVTITCKCSIYGQEYNGSIITDKNLQLLKEGKINFSDRFNGEERYIAYPVDSWDLIDEDNGVEFPITVQGITQLKGCSVSTKLKVSQSVTVAASGWFTPKEDTSNPYSINADGSYYQAILNENRIIKDIDFDVDATTDPQYIHNFPVNSNGEVIFIVRHAAQDYQLKFPKGYSLQYVIFLSQPQKFQDEWTTALQTDDSVDQNSSIFTLEVSGSASPQVIKYKLTKDVNI